MRNPAPLVFTLILALAAGFLILRKPQPAAATPPQPASKQPAEAAKNAEAAESAPAPAPRSWAHEKSDIAPDPQAIFGRLENGLSYIIYPNSEPPERVSLRLHIAAGSLMEADDQRGLAHFLEHMVFNGSKSFTTEELIPQMQRLGISFGAHVNAYTSFDETVYMLDLPDLSDATLDLGFTVMRDFGDGALLEEDEIDKERGVILSEKTSRDSVSYRLMEQQFQSILPDSLLTERFPIGKEEVISNAPRERFIDFYTRFYTPERMTFVVVGDVDPAMMEERIRKSFGSMTQPENPGADPDLGSIVPISGVEPAVFSDKEVSGTELGLLTVEPHAFKADTKASRIEHMPLDIANSVLARRFERIAKQDGSPILGGSASRSELFNHAELGSIDVSVADDRWQDALPVLVEEFRRAVEFGFTAAELAEAKANLLNAYEQAVKSKDTRRSDGIASGIAGSLNEGAVFSTPETDLAIASEGLDAVTAESAHQAFAGFWRDKGLRLILTTKVEPDDAAGTLSRLYEESAAKPVTPPEEKSAQSFAYTDFGPPGTVATTTQVEDLGITQLVLSNGVTVNLKPTDFQQNTILLAARIGDGKLSQPADKPGIDLFASQLIEAGGIGEHSGEDLQQIFAGRNIGFGFSVGEGSFSLAGSTTPDDLELELQAMTAQILTPGYREEAVTLFRKSIPMIYQQMTHTPAGAMQQMNSWLHGDDPRFAFPEEGTLAGYTIEDARPWLEREFSNGPIELNLVGDFTVDAVVPLILKTFGAIEARTEPAPLPADARKVAFPNAPATKTFTYVSKVPKGQAMVIWRTAGLRGNQQEFRRLNLLADIFSDRLREEIREELGASYSPNAGPNGSEDLEDFGFIIAMSTCKPEDATKLADLTRELAATLAEQGATADELDRARQPALADIRKTIRDNSYWLGSVLAGSSEDSKRFDLARSRLVDYESITLEEINRLAAKHLADQNALQVIIRPTDPVQE